MNDKNTQLFMSLVYSFQMQCMIQLGKLKNPMTDQVDRDLNAAQITIEMLDMLKEKTANNLSDQEKKFLEQATAELKLNYVDEKAKEDKGSSASTEGEDKLSEGQQPAEESSEESR